MTSPGNFRENVRIFVGMKEERIEFAISTKSKVAFAKACKKNDTTMSQVIREYIKTYTQTHK